MLERVFLGWTSTKQGLMSLAQGHNTVTPGRLEPATPGSRDKHSTTEPLLRKSDKMQGSAEHYIAFSQQDQ